MTLVSYVEDDIYQKALRSPQTANLLRVLFHSPLWATQFVKLATAQMTELSLDPALRELVILHTSRLIHSDYVWAQHVGISQAFSISESQRDALRQGDLTAADFSEKEQRLLSFVSALRHVTPMHAKELASLRAFFSEQEIVEIIGVHGFAYTVAVLTTALDVEIDPISGDRMLEFVERVRHDNRSE